MHPDSPLVGVNVNAMPDVRPTSKAACARFIVSTSRWRAIAWARRCTRFTPSSVDATCMPVIELICSRLANCGVGSPGGRGGIRDGVVDALLKATSCGDGVGSDDGGGGGGG